jgi:hypothetical protein
MSKHITFVIAATIMAVAMAFWAHASFEMPNGDVVPANVAPHAAHPILPFQVLSPAY